MFDTRYLLRASRLVSLASSKGQLQKRLSSEHAERGGGGTLASARAHFNLLELYMNITQRSTQIFQICIDIRRYKLI